VAGDMALLHLVQEGRGGGRLGEGGGGGRPDEGGGGWSVVAGDVV
jgi:hypothetical protein